MRGATRQLKTVLFGAKNFNPRTPCGVRHSKLCHQLQKSAISIHAPHAGCDRHCTPLYELVVYFNPRTPCGVRHSLPHFAHFAIFISIHAPHAGCDTLPDGWTASRLAFQSTHPMRGATGQDCKPFRTSVISIHAPHAGCDCKKPTIRQKKNISIHAPHAGCDEMHVCTTIHKRYFNPRTPCGVRPSADGKFQPTLHFNPRTPCGVRLISAGQAL